MKQGDKEVLLTDLCSRLPYGVKVNEDIQGDFTLIGLTKERALTTCEVEGKFNNFPIELIKPYLFPLSSMSDEQMKEWKSLMIEDPFGILYHTVESYDYLYKNHIDIRGLIPMGLGIDATNLKIY